MSHVLLVKGMEGHFDEKIFQLGEAYTARNIAPRIDRYAASADLHHLRLQTACLDSILRNERERHAQQKELFKKRWVTAANKLRKVDVSITNFDHAYQENIAEVQRQTHVAARQDDLRDIKRGDLQRLRKEKALLNEVKGQTTSRLGNYNPVNKYLTNVVDGSRGEFKNARELIERAKLLLNTRTELVARNDAADAKMLRQEMNLEKSRMVKSNEVIILNNYIFELSQNLSDGRALLRRIEDEVSRVKTTASKRTLILSEIKTAVLNIYLQMCATTRVRPRIKPTDTIKQLTAITSSMQEMRKAEAMIRYIIKKAKGRAAAENAERDRRSSAAKESEKAQLKRIRNKTREIFGLRAHTLDGGENADDDAIRHLTKRTTKESKEIGS